MMVVNHKFWFVNILVCMLVVWSNAIDCNKLTDDEMWDVKMISRECKEATNLGRDPSAEPRHLDVSSLSELEFKDLFAKKSSLKVGITASNSKIVNMEFTKLTSIEDDKLHQAEHIIYLVDNRQLKSVSFPAMQNGMLVRKDCNSSQPIQLKSNPLLPAGILEKLRDLFPASLSISLQNVEGVCHLTQVIHDLSELDNCDKITSNLIIDRAIGKTSARITEVTGYIRITNSNIDNLSFLKEATRQFPTPTEDFDEISANPNLCITKDDLLFLEKRDMKQHFYNNKHPLLCAEPATTCMGGSLREAAVRKRIEAGNCQVIIGDLSIDHLINVKTDLTEELRAGLSRIKRIVNGSLFVIANDGITHLNFFQSLVEILSPSCHVTAVGIWANFNLKKIELPQQIKLKYHGFGDGTSCLKMTIGGNGEEGRDRILTEKQIEDYGLKGGLVAWIHPRDKSYLKKEEDEEQDFYIVLGVFAFVLVCSLVVIPLFIFKMIKLGKSKRKETEDVEVKERVNKEEKKEAAQDIKQHAIY